MTLSLFLIQLAGVTILLLHAMRLVTTGVERASGPSLRPILFGKKTGENLVRINGHLNCHSTAKRDRDNGFDSWLSMFLFLKTSGLGAF
ncbi:hypothetical protein N9K16_04245 [Alphaproteobacteria bacterium]|jgi:hypothetical protein|nr:hypothetical protein [Alphaproteobacteria bacterium]